MAKPSTLPEWSRPDLRKLLKGARRDCLDTDPWAEERAREVLKKPS